MNITLLSGKTLPLGFNIRPFTHKCLELVNQHFEVIVFTASNKGYADVVLDHIDPDHKLIQHRVYRDNCVKTKGNIYIKDLRIFKNRDLKDMIIVDNAVYSFGSQLANGVPITPFKDDSEDREFQYLMNYLMILKDCDDMRELNKEAFKMEQVYQFELDPYIHYYDYDLCDEHSDDEEYSEIDKSTVEYTESLENDARTANLSAAMNLGSVISNRSSTVAEYIDDKKLNSINCMQNLAAAFERQSRKARLPKNINTCLDEFTKNIAKAKSFHLKMSK